MNQVTSSALSLSDEARQLAAHVLTPDSSAFDWVAVRRLLENSGEILVVLKHALGAGNAALKLRFLANETAAQLVVDRSTLVDMVIATAWQRTLNPIYADCALVAVGGYGRAELHPYSDVDLLVLTPSRAVSPPHDSLSNFLTLLWDSGIEIRHSVRSAAECGQDAGTDLTLVTTLMEARLLLGPEDLLWEMQSAIAPSKIWPSRQFFPASCGNSKAGIIAMTTPPTTWNRMSKGVRAGYGTFRPLAG